MAVVRLIENNSNWAAFFEIECSTGESWGGGMISLAGWCVIIVGIVAVLVKIAEGK